MQNTIFHLLLRLRKVDQPVVLWIDTICIHKADLEERSSQAEMMGRIYSSAAWVVVWVREEDSRTGKVARFLDEMVMNLQSGQPKGVQELDRMDVRWTDLAEFLNRAWFTSTWVLQELCLARHCSLRCGSHCWPWEALENVFDHLIALGIGDVPGAARRLDRGVVEFTRTWRKSKTRGEISLAQLLKATRGTFASVPADKLYGILSLANDRLGIRVQYEKKTQDIFKDAAQKIASPRSTPELLSMASDNVWNQTCGLPTWVPDWACVDKPTSLNISWLQSGEAAWEAMGMEFEEAAINHGVVLEDGILRLQMLEVDRISGTGVPWPGHKNEQQLSGIPIWDIGTFGAKKLENWHSMLPQDVKGDRHSYARTEEHRVATLMRTLVADSVSLPTCCSTWQAVYPVFSDRLNWLQRFNSARVHSAFSKHEDPMADYHDAVKTFCHKRTLLFSKGGYMGLGPFNRLPFDRILVVPGLCTRLVMRRTLKGGYKIIGECYLQGVVREVL